MIEQTVSGFSSFGPMDIVGPVIGACVFIAVMSIVREPVRQKFNAILVAGAGASYYLGGLGAWEYLYAAVATIVAYQGLRSYRFIALAWLMHVCWDIVHHLYGTEIWPWMDNSSVGCAIFDVVIAIWFFHGAPAVYKLVRGKDRGNTSLKRTAKANIKNQT